MQSSVCVLLEFAREETRQKLVLFSHALVHLFLEQTSSRMTFAKQIQINDKKVTGKPPCPENGETAQPNGSSNVTLSRVIFLWTHV